MSDSEDEVPLCPLCMEVMDIDDRCFFPCECDYQICRFCYHRIIETFNGKCPACRRVYDEKMVRWNAISAEQMAKSKADKRAKEREKKELELGTKKHLANIRVIQRNLAYVVGLPPHLATEETLKGPDYFGQFGKINKIVINKKQIIPPRGGDPIISVGAYVTFASKEDTATAIRTVDGSTLENRLLRATYGTTKYCSYYLKGIVCQNPNCMYLHEPGEEADYSHRDENSKTGFRPLDAASSAKPYTARSTTISHHPTSYHDAVPRSHHSPISHTPTNSSEHDYPTSSRPTSTVSTTQTSISISSDDSPKQPVKSNTTPPQDNSLCIGNSSALPATASWANRSAAKASNAPPRKSTALLADLEPVKISETPKKAPAADVVENPVLKKALTSVPTIDTKPKSVTTDLSNSSHGSYHSSPKLSSGSSSHPALQQLSRERKEQMKKQSAKASNTNSEAKTNKNQHHHLKETVSTDGDVKNSSSNSDYNPTRIDYSNSAKTASLETKPVHSSEPLLPKHESDISVSLEKSSRNAGSMTNVVANILNRANVDESNKTQANTKKVNNNDVSGKKVTNEKARRDILPGADLSELSPSENLTQNSTESQSPKVTNDNKQALPTDTLSLNHNATNEPTSSLSESSDHLDQNLTLADSDALLNNFNISQPLFSPWQNNIQVFKDPSFDNNVLSQRFVKNTLLNGSDPLSDGDFNHTASNNDPSLISNPMLNQNNWTPNAQLLNSQKLFSPNLLSQKNILQSGYYSNPKPINDNISPLSNILQANQSQSYLNRPNSFYDSRTNSANHPVLGTSRNTLLNHGIDNSFLDSPLNSLSGLNEGFSLGRGASKINRNTSRFGFAQVTGANLQDGMVPSNELNQAQIDFSRITNPQGQSFDSGNSYAPNAGPYLGQASNCNSLNVGGNTYTSFLGLDDTSATNHSDFSLSQNSKQFKQDNFYNSKSSLRLNDTLVEKSPKLDLMNSARFSDNHKNRLSSNIGDMTSFSQFSGGSDLKMDGLSANRRLSVKNTTDMYLPSNYDNPIIFNQSKLPMAQLGQFGMPLPSGYTHPLNNIANPHVQSIPLQNRALFMERPGGLSSFGLSLSNMSPNLENMNIKKQHIDLDPINLPTIPSHVSGNLPFQDPAIVHAQLSRPQLETPKSTVSNQHLTNLLTRLNLGGTKSLLVDPSALELRDDGRLDQHLPEATRTAPFIADPAIMSMGRAQLQNATNSDQTRLNEQLDLKNSALTGSFFVTGAAARNNIGLTPIHGLYHETASSVKVQGLNSIVEETSDNFICVKGISVSDIDPSQKNDNSSAVELDNQSARSVLDQSHSNFSTPSNNTKSTMRLPVDISEKKLHTSASIIDRRDNLERNISNSGSSVKSTYSEKYISDIATNNVTALGDTENCPTISDPNSNKIDTAINGKINEKYANSNKTEFVGKDDTEIHKICQGNHLTRTSQQRFSESVLSDPNSTTFSQIGHFDGKSSLSTETPTPSRDDPLVYLGLSVQNNGVVHSDDISFALANSSNVAVPSIDTLDHLSQPNSHQSVSLYLLNSARHVSAGQDLEKKLLKTFQRTKLFEEQLLEFLVANDSSKKLRA